MVAHEKVQQSSNSDLRDPVQVFSRLRPLQEETNPSCVKLLSPTTLSLVSESKFGRKECNYVFRHVFTSYAGQREIFEHVALPLLEDLVKGKNGLLFTYGVTGSGKTYTLTGEQSMPGIMPRCIDTLFNSIEDLQTQKFVIKSDRMNGFEIQTESDALEDRFLETKSSSKRLRVVKRGAGDARNLYNNDGMKLSMLNTNCHYAVFISYTEIYNNTVYDLLDEAHGKVLQAKIIREDSQKNMYVNGVVEVEVKSAAEAFELFYVGQKRKRMALTVLNAESSRSHSIFNIRVVQLEQVPQCAEGQAMIPEQHLIKIGQLSLVDLAGSERCNRSQTTGMRLKEASCINNSLMTLRTCLEILRENQLTGGNKLVPYRDSRLTLLFKNYFEGEGQVRMIVCVNPSEQDSEENLQVLKFAEMTQDVKTPRPESRYTPYRKTPKANKTPTVQTPVTLKVKKVLSFSFGPKIPSVKLSMEEPEENCAVLESLLKILHARKQKGETNRRELIQKEEHFRKRLGRINQESVLAKSEIRSLKAMLRKEKQISQNLNVKITDLETANHNLVDNNDKLQEVIQTLHNTIDEKNLKINQNHLEREKSKHKLAMQTEKLNQELDEKLRRQREHLQKAMQAKDAKLQKVKEILESDTVSVCSLEHPQYRTEIVQTVEMPATNVVRTQTEVTQEKGIPVANPKHQRSMGEVWLEHNSVKKVPLGTVMQPSLKKRKSVNKLKNISITDITDPKTSKYCLIAQRADIDGDMETNLYKADIVPTCCGGAQVIFNDVECLRQESPSKHQML